MIWGFSYTDVAVALGAFVVSTLATTFVVGWFLVGIRHDYFVAGTRGLSRKIASPITRGLYIAGKNLLGLVLVLIGIVLSLPGVPGQGLLTMFVGILLLDVPGKRRFERRLVRRPPIKRAINRLRERFKRAPLELDDDPNSTQELA